MTMSPTGTDALDRATLQRLASLDPGGRRRLVERLLETYADSLVRLVGQARDGCARRDAQAVKLAVHTLRSSSASLGAKGLAELCGQAERGVGDVGSQAFVELMGRLGAEAERVAAAVDALRSVRQP